LFLSLAFLGVGSVPKSILEMTNTMFALFGMVTFGVATISFVLSQFFEEVNSFQREAAEGLYQWTSFVPSVILSELPFTILTSAFFFLLSYFVVGLRLDLAAPAF
jgi:ATP-binding cassette subfamily G (WHITE) protein 2 (SNQ2)